MSRGKNTSVGPRFSSPFMVSLCRGRAGHIIRKQARVTCAFVEREGGAMLRPYMWSKAEQELVTPHNGKCAHEIGE